MKNIELINDGFGRLAKKISTSQCQFVEIVKEVTVTVAKEEYWLIHIKWGGKHLNELGDSYFPYSDKTALRVRLLLDVFGFKEINIPPPKAYFDEERDTLTIFSTRVFVKSKY